MWSAVGACPRSRHRVRRRVIAAVRAALLVVLTLVAAAAWMPAVHAVVLRLRGGTVDRAITVGRAVDTVLMDGVYITNGVAVVFDVAAMLPGPLHIELRNCVCDGGARAYVAIVLLLTTVLLAVTVYSVVVWYVEDCHWQELREPRRGGLEALLRDDEESDEETRKPYDMTLSSYASGTTAASSYRPPAPP